MLSQRVSRSFNLLRYHKPSQFLWRGVGVAKRISQKIIPDQYESRTETVQFSQHASERLRPLHKRRLLLWPQRTQKDFLDDLQVGRFCFLAHARALMLPDGSIDWNPTEPRLWRFHLQCQESLLDLAAHRNPASSWRIVESWLNEQRHQTPQGDPDAWHPFCISRRLPVWLMLAAEYPPPMKLASTFWQAVSNQVDWLRTHLEVDLGGNHLFENLRALAISEAVLEGRIHVDKHWLDTHICKQIDEQVLLSGEHFERVPTYHALMLLAVLELADVVGWREQSSEVFSKLNQAAQMMRCHLESILHPDGQIPLFGDSVFGETPQPKILCEGESSDAPSLSNRPNYWTAGTGQNRLIVDFGPVACDHLPAHAHADLFTLEASVSGQRIIVDSGTYDYEISAMRKYCRSTTAHNTASIDGEDQCDMWSRFRMGRRGRPREFSYGTNSTQSISWARGWHDAYQHLGVPQMHRIVLSRRDEAILSHSPNEFDWVVVDLAPKKSLPMTSHVHIHPRFDMTQSKRFKDQTQSFALQTNSPPEIRARLDCLAFEKLAVGDGWYCPDFGHRITNPAVTLYAKNVDTSDGPTNLTCWRLCSPENQFRADVCLSQDTVTLTWRHRDEPVDDCTVAIESTKRP